MGIEDFLNTPYKLKSSDNFESYLEAIGVAPEIRKLIVETSPVITLTESGGQYTALYESALRNHTIEFIPGVEFEDEGLDGRKLRSIITIDGNKMAHTILDPQSVINSEFSGDELKMVFSAGNTTATRVFEKV